MSQDQEVLSIARRFVGAVAASGDVTVQSTVEWYKTRLKSFLTWARDNQRAALEDTTFNAFVVHLKQRVKEETLSEHSLPGFYRVLRRFGEWLQAEGYVQADPARALKMPRPGNNQPPKSLTDEEVEKMLAASKVKPREAAMVRCLLYSGARAEELIWLHWRSIRWERNPVGALVQAKGNKMRWIFFAPEAVEALKEYRAWLPPECAGDDQPVWWGCRSGDVWRPLTYSGLYHALRRLARSAGAEHFNPHRWRHYFARCRRRKNQTLSDVQDLLGHSSPETTKIYDRLTPDELGQAYLRFV